MEIYAQAPDSTLSEVIAVAARPSKDSISVRWAPLSLSVWQKGNRSGYIVERYVIVRNQRVLPVPEKTILTSVPLKPIEESRWEPLVRSNRYGAIAAQALFGDRFEVDLSKSDVFTIVNKVRENEQRFAFALFCADMSPAVARASGLWFTDRTVKSGEKYLYRVIIPEIENMQQSRGSIFTGTDEVFDLPKPTNLKVEVKEHIVSLKWDKSLVGKYTAFILERSADGKSFRSVSDAPLVTVSPTEQEDTRYEYASDSLPDLSQTYYYRVKGISPFGDESVASDVVSAKGTIVVTDVPYIREAENINNNSIRLSWEFEEKSNAVLKGFSVERSATPRGNFSSITLQAPLPPTARSHEDRSPGVVNYYRVVAHGLDGQTYRSPLYLAQLIDSIPPGPPVGLKAAINEYGKLDLSWQPNTEGDIYGYRVYKGNHESEELAQVTAAPLSQTLYTENLDLHTLNEAVYYKVMAIDRNQNHSALSVLLKVDLPDKVKPMPPVFLPVKSTENGISLSWLKSSSQDVVQYDVYRRGPDKKEWQRIKVIQATADTAYQYTDDNAGAGIANHYTVTAVDEAQLESDPAVPVSGVKIDNGLKAPIEWKQPVLLADQKQVVLSWGYDLPGVSMFRIYRSDGENPAVMYKSLTGDKRNFTDRLAFDKEYKYQVIVIFENGAKSRLSEALSVKL